MLLREGWAKRVVIRFIPAPVTITIIALRVVGALVCHWAAGVLPEPYAHIMNIASHAFAILAFMMAFGTIEKAFATHIYYGALKLRGYKWERRPNSQPSRS
jgi:hypothetical protein